MAKNRSSFTKKLIGFFFIFLVIGDFSRLKLNCLFLENNIFRINFDQVFPLYRLELNQDHDIHYRTCISKKKRGIMMRALEEIGTCPQCECSLMIYKTKNYKRFVKCDVCGISYALPKAGKIEGSGLRCPKSGFPILIIQKKGQRCYFWADGPCFDCIDASSCEPMNALIKEFEDLKVYGY